MELITHVRFGLLLIVLENNNTNVTIYDLAIVFLGVRNFPYLFGHLLVIAQSWTNDISSKCFNCICQRSFQTIWIEMLLCALVFYVAIQKQLTQSLLICTTISCLRQRAFANITLRFFGIPKTIVRFCVIAIDFLLSGFVVYTAMISDDFINFTLAFTNLICSLSIN